MKINLIYNNTNSDFHEEELNWDEVHNAPHGYGGAIAWVYETEDGRLWVDNDEYVSQVNFCPFTGYEAKVKVKNEN